MFNSFFSGLYHQFMASRLRAEMPSIMISHAKGIPMMQTYKLALLTALLLGGAASVLPAADWPMLGRDGTRNAVSPEQGAPIDWDVGQYDPQTREYTGARGVKWTARLGHTTFGTPVVADGLVWIGTTDLDNNRSGVLRCFRESDGEPLYEFESPDGGNRVNVLGIGCSPLVEGDRLWFTTNQNVVVCLDIAPLKTGEGEPRELWKLDPREQLGVFPRAMLMGPAADPAVAMRNVQNGIGEPIALVDMAAAIYSSPIFANGTLYVATGDTLFAIAAEDTPALGGHWPQWRGPNRDNVSTETGLLQQWPEEGPPLVWRVEGLGEGIASVAVAGGRICTISRAEDREYIVMLDEKSGEHLWTAYLGRTVPQQRLMQWLTQRTPTVAGRHLYAVSSLGDLVCLQTADGRELWRKSYEEDLQGKRGLFGYGDRPLVDGDRLIVMPGGETAPVTALNRWTGEVLWKCAVADEEKPPYGDYSTGVIADIHGVRQFVASVNPYVVGIAVEDGRLLWRHEVAGNRPIHSTLTPLVRDRHIVVPVGYGQQLLSLEIVSRDDGYVAQDAYAVRARLDPFADNTCLVDEHLYIFGNIASCHRWSTGEAVWQTRIAQGRGRAMATFADGRAYLRDSAGAVKLLQATPEGLVENGEFTLPEARPASGATLPVIAGGRLYLRDDSRLFCYDVRDDATDRPPSPATTIQLLPLVADAPPPPGRPRVGINRAPDAVFVPTPHDVVAAMLQLAGVEKTDVVYDLGSGDGRIVIAAAKTYGAQAVGVEIDPELVQLSQRQVTENKLEDLVTIRHEDMFQTDFSGADVVAVFLFPQLLDRLKPQFAKLKPGTRIVSHQFEIPGVEPDRTISIRSNTDGDLHRILLWTTPLKEDSQPPE